jgi:predicted transposase/invertase (TIGR01784 family)
MRKERPLISFDWAIKRLLRQKANYDILEGFLSELLKQDIRITNIPESESNKVSAEDKFNKVDILCENENKELILIELQYDNQADYFYRMLYGTSKLITEYMDSPMKYDEIKKVYSINIVYFELGQGEDYVYYGKNEFKGIHLNDILKVTEQQSNLYHKSNVYEFFPEYYIIKVNNFNNVAKDRLDEWIYYFKNNEVLTNFKAKGLDKVASQLKLDDMSKQDKIDYEAHQKINAISNSVIQTSLYDEREKHYQEKLSLVRNMISEGIDKNIIVKITGFSLEFIENL